MLNTIDKYLSKFENTINGGLMLLGVIVLSVNIIMRYFFHSSSTWVEEALRYAVIWVTFFGGSQCAKMGNHVGIDLVVQLMPKVSQRFLNALGQFIAAAFNAVCTVAGFQITMMVVSTAQKSPAMLLPMWIVYLSIPLGCALMTIRFIVSGLLALREKGGSLLTDEEGNIDMNRL